jgi:hypothetical protein
LVFEFQDYYLKVVAFSSQDAYLKEERVVVEDLDCD